MPKTWFRGLYPQASAKKKCVSPLPGCQDPFSTSFVVLFIIFFLLSSVAKYLISVEITTLQV